MRTLNGGRSGGVGLHVPISTPISQVPHRIGLAPLPFLGVEAFARIRARGLRRTHVGTLAKPRFVATLATL